MDKLTLVDKQSGQIVYQQLIEKAEDTQTWTNKLPDIPPGEYKVFIETGLLHTMVENGVISIPN